MARCCATWAATTWRAGCARWALGPPWAARRSKAPHGGAAALPLTALRCAALQKLWRPGGSRRSRLCHRPSPNSPAASLCTPAWHADYANAGVTALCARCPAPAPRPGMQVLLRRFPKSHPFASLTGTENCISFTTLRYRWGLSRLYRPLACNGCGCYDERGPRRIPLPAGVPHIPMQPLGRPPS